MVEYVPSAGAFVRERSPQELSDMFDLREALEPMAAAKAAEHISEQEVEELQTIVDDWREMVRGLRHRPEGHLSPSQMERWQDNERRFAQVLIDAARNGLLSKMARELLVVGQVFDAQRSEPPALTPAAAEGRARAYDILLQGLRGRDPARMRELMLAHIKKEREPVVSPNRRNGPRRNDRKR